MNRVNQDQMSKLLDLMSGDGVLVNGKVSYTNTNRQKFWKRVAMQLNSVEGGVCKNPWKWCKTWADWKNKTKKKANIILRKDSHSPEGHPTPSLSTLERRLLQIINYSLEDKRNALKLEMVTKIEEPDNSNGFHIEYLNEEFSEVNNKDGALSEDDKDSDCFDTHSNNFCDVDDIIQDDKFEGVDDSSDFGHKVKSKRKLTLEEYKIRTTLKLEKDKVQQKSEELRLKALELKLKGEELRLKEVEMNKINYLTNIEEEKLKCFKDISLSLKEFLEQTRSGNIRFQNNL